MVLRKLDSLFLRLMLALLLLVACALLIFGALLVMERNELVAPQLAMRWAPAIQAMARPGAAPTAEYLHTQIRRQDHPPDNWTMPARQMPALAAFVRELASQGVVVDDARFGRADGQFALWLHVPVPGATPVWLSAPVPLTLLPVWAPQLGIGLALLLGFIALVSWSVARWVTRPLAQLRQRIQSHAYLGVEPSAPWPAARDIQAPPELIAIEKAYRMLAERLQRNERERALLLAGVSHDLRSPLSRIRLAAEMLPESPDNAAGVASITRNVDHADRLTASFLEFIRASTVPFNDTVDLAEAVREAVDGFERPAHELSVRAPDHVVLERTDRLLVQRLAINLVDNAIKHGGVPVFVELQREGAWAVLTVSDAGPGLPENRAEHLLQAFARGDASRGVPGFGLGLAITQQIVVRMCGELRFGHPGERHRVTIRLPLPGGEAR